MIWRNLFRVFGIIGMIMITFSVFIIGYSVTIEGYNRFSPWIDTKTTDSYSEQKFNMIEIGMDTIQVKGLVGEPFSRQITDWHNDRLKTQFWYFTGDGKFEKGDFAWIGRELYISDDGKVTEILRTIHHD